MEKWAPALLLHVPALMEQEAHRALWTTLVWSLWSSPSRPATCIERVLLILFNDWAKQRLEVELKGSKKCSASPWSPLLAHPCKEVAEQWKQQWVTSERFPYPVSAGGKSGSMERIQELVKVVPRVAGCGELVWEEGHLGSQPKSVESLRYESNLL